MLSDLRESGSIEQDADIVAFLYREDYYKKELERKDQTSDVEFIIAKHRKGATDIVLLDFKGEFTRFENPEDNSLGDLPLTEGGEIRGSAINGENGNMPFPPPDTNEQFNVV